MSGRARAERRTAPRGSISRGQLPLDARARVLAVAATWRVEALVSAGCPSVGPWWVALSGGLMVGTWAIVCSARAVIVRLGFTPGLAGSAEPSVISRF